MYNVYMTDFVRIIKESMIQIHNCNKFEIKYNPVDRVYKYSIGISL